MDGHDRGQVDLGAPVSDPVSLTGFTRFDGAFHYRANKTYGLQINVENLLDKRYFQYADSNNNSPASGRGGEGEPYRPLASAVALRSEAGGDQKSGRASVSSLASRTIACRRWR